jgi:integrase
MAAAQSRSRRTETEFRIGKVKGYLRGQVWYLCYVEEGRRRRPRVGPRLDLARQLAAQINGQLEVGAPAALSFQSISIPALRDAWLSHHEHVRRSSLQTLRRYRTATEHLLRFLVQRPVKSASNFRVTHAEEFVRYLRELRVAPNGHPHSRQRPLLDKGIQFILECCRSLFVFAAKRRHLTPYAENPFSALEISRMPIEHRRAIVLPTTQQAAELLAAAEEWAFSIFVTLALTGLRPGELVHLLVEDFDPVECLLHVRNRPGLGWQAKTRQDRSVPVLGPLARCLSSMIGARSGGTLFQRCRFRAENMPAWAHSAKSAMQELRGRSESREAAREDVLTRVEQAAESRKIWTEMGMIKPDVIRIALGRLAVRTQTPELSTPKMFRHLFATALQEGRVDPLIRNELLGHIPEDGPRTGGGLGMTANYTHTRLETKREQLDTAFVAHPILQVLNVRIQK